MGPTTSRPPCSLSSRSVKKHVLFDFRESYVLDFEKKFLSNDFDAVYSCKDIVRKCNMFYGFLQDAMNAIPETVVLITNFDAPWMTPLIKFLIDC